MTSEVAMGEAVDLRKALEDIKVAVGVPNGDGYTLAGHAWWIDDAVLNGHRFSGDDEKHASARAKIEEDAIKLVDMRLVELHNHGGWHFGFDAQTGENFIGFGTIMNKDVIRIPVPTFAIAQYIGKACMRMQDKMHYHGDSNNWCDGTPDWCDVEQGIPA